MAVSPHSIITPSAPAIHREPKWQGDNMYCKCMSEILDAAKLELTRIKNVDTENIISAKHASGVWVHTKPHGSVFVPYHEVKVEHFAKTRTGKPYKHPKITSIFMEQTYCAFCGTKLPINGGDLND